MSQLEINIEKRKLEVWNQFPPENRQKLLKNAILYAIGLYKAPATEQHYNPIDLLPVTTWSNLRLKLWEMLNEEKKDDMITDAILHKLGEYDYKTIPADPIKTIPPEVLQALNEPRVQPKTVPDYITMLESLLPLRKETSAKEKQIEYSV